MFLDYFGSDLEATHPIAMRQFKSRCHAETGVMRLMTSHPSLPVESSLQK